MIETLEQACVRVQKEYQGCDPRSSGGPDVLKRLDEERRELFALAIRRGVSYRQIADAVGMSASGLNSILSYLDTKPRENPFAELLSTARRRDANAA